MIVRDRPSGLRLFLVYRGSVLKRILPVLSASILFALVVTLSHGRLYDVKIVLTAIPFTLIGLPLAIFLGFRNTAAYDRYWEARKLWGDLAIRCHALVRQTRIFLPGNDDRTGLDDPATRLAMRALAFTYAVRDRLRDSPAALQPTGALLGKDEHEGMASADNKPRFLMDRMAEDLQRCLQRKELDTVSAAAIESTLGGMAAAWLACERIRFTPIPFSYTLLLHRTAYIYCFLLPFGLVDVIGFMTPLVVAVVAYTFFALDAVGDEIEEPFGSSANDLPLDAICRSIEIAVKEGVGAKDIPTPLVPRNFCLM